MVQLEVDELLFLISQTLNKQNFILFMKRLNRAIKIRLSSYEANSHYDGKNLEIPTGWYTKTIEESVTKAFSEDEDGFYLYELHYAKKILSQENNIDFILQMSSTTEEIEKLYLKLLLEKR